MEFHCLWYPAEALDHEYESVLRHTLEGVILLTLHPRTAIQIVVQVVQQDGSILACAVNAACAALADAGVPMSCMVGASSCVLRRDGVLVVDPDGQEEEAAQAVVSAAFHYRGGAAVESDASDPTVDEGVAMCYAVGPLSEGQYLQAVDVCRAGCKRVAFFMKLAIGKSFTLLR